MTKKMRNAEYNGLDWFYGLSVNTHIDERTMLTDHFSYTQTNFYFWIIAQDVFFKFPHFILRPVFAPVSRYSLHGETFAMDALVSSLVKFKSREDYLVRATGDSTF